jgi:hypothetical protein
MTDNFEVDMQSATPRGFAKAVCEANKREY